MKAFVKRHWVLILCIIMFVIWTIWFIRSVDADIKEKAYIQSLEEQVNTPSELESLILDLDDNRAWRETEQQSIDYSIKRKAELSLEADAIKQQISEITGVDFQ